MKEKATKQVVDEIFGDNGLIEADTTVAFTKQVNIIESKYQAMIGPFFTNKVIPTIKEYVYNARKTESRITLQWKNNSCESINHILKLNQDWKVFAFYDIDLFCKRHSCVCLDEAIITKYFVYYLFSSFFFHSHFISHVPRHVFTQVPGIECKLRIRKA
jgi:hypothetical protein